MLPNSISAFDLQKCISHRFYIYIQRTANVNSIVEIALDKILITVLEFAFKIKNKVSSLLYFVH